MASLPGLLRADLLKSRHTPFLLIHLLVPLIGVGVFLAYYSYSPWSATDKALAFMQSLGCAFPTLIGLVCSMAVEQEAAAGQFQSMLAIPANKITAYISKLLLLLLFGFGAVLFAYTLLALGSAEFSSKTDWECPFTSPGRLFCSGAICFSTFFI